MKTKAKYQNHRQLSISDILLVMKNIEKDFPWPCRYLNWFDKSSHLRFYHRNSKSRTLIFWANVITKFSGNVSAVDMDVLFKSCFYYPITKLLLTFKYVWSILSWYCWYLFFLECFLVLHITIQTQSNIYDRAFSKKYLTSLSH